MFDSGRFFRFSAIRFYRRKSISINDPIDFYQLVSAKIGREIDKSEVGKDKQNTTTTENQSNTLNPRIAQCRLQHLDFWSTFLSSPTSALIPRNKGKATFHHAGTLEIYLVAM